MENKYNQAYYESFFLALIISWLPFKSISYVAPFISLGWYILRSNSGRTLINSTLLLLIFVALVAFYYFLSWYNEYEYLIQNSVLSLITYGSFFFLLASKGKLNFDDVFYQKISRLLGVVITIESVVGIFQFLLAVISRGFGGSSGDVVQGTIYLLSFYESADMGFGNQIFTINMSFMILYYLPYVLSYGKGYMTLVFGTISLMLALVSHVIIPLLVAFGIVYLLFKKSVIGRLKLKHIVLSFIFGMAILFVYQLQSELVNHYIKKFVQLESPKAKVTVNTLRELPGDYPTSVIFGLGPGQFSSRAGLIGTGRYIGGLKNQKSLPFLDSKMTPAFEKYVFPQYQEYLTNPKYGLSTMSRPFHSILSIYVEFGLVIFIALLFLIFRLVVRLRRYYLTSLKQGKALLANLSFVSAIAVLLIFFISFFENYLELTQAIFPGLILIKVFYHSVKNDLSSR